MASPGVTVQGTFLDLQNNPVVGLKVGFTIYPTTPSYAGPWEISGTGILPQPPTTIFATTNASGFFTITLWGNDQFSQPSSSYYAVEAGNFAFQYLFLNGNTYNLLTATPLNPVPAAPAPPGAQNANLILAGPATGSPALPTFRGMVIADMPVSGTWPFTGTFSGAATFSGTNTHSGAETFTGAVTNTAANAVRYIAPGNPQGWAGSDIGAWVNAAVSNCAGPCNIQIAPGTYTLSTMISISQNNVHISGSSVGDNNASSTHIIAATNSNLAQMINSTGFGFQIDNIYLDGNCPFGGTCNQGSGSGGAYNGVFSNAGKFTSDHLYVGNFAQHGIVFGPNTQGSHHSNCASFSNVKNGIEFQASGAQAATDTWLNSCEVDNNGNNQIHALSSALGQIGGIHIIGGDYSGAVGGSDCIFFDGTSSSVNEIQIVGANILPCPQNGVRMINANGPVISGMYILNVGGAANNTYDGIQINNFEAGSIVGNLIVDGSTSCSGHSCMRYGVNIIAATQKGQLGPNSIRGFQTASYNPTALDDVLGGASGTLNIVNNTLQVSSLNATAITNAKGLQLFNTTTTCTTAGSVGATCTTGAISLPVVEADTSYRVTCTGKGLTNVPVVVATTNSSASQFTITIAALTAAAASFASYDCVVGHN
jgi:hypothetical protein